VAATPGSLWVPPGRSAWELGTDANVRAKAQQDYVRRTSDALGLVPSETVFVFATPRRWSGAEEWERIAALRASGATSASSTRTRLEAWLEGRPASSCTGSPR